MKVIAALTAALLFAASTQTSQGMPCELYAQLVERNVNDPGILPMQKQCYVGMAEYTCEQCNGNMACIKSRGTIGREESTRIMSNLPECAELMQLARGVMPKRRLRSHAMSQGMPCELYAQLVERNVNDPGILPMQKQCYVGMAEYTCEQCNGNMACIKSRGTIGREESTRIMSNLPECAELMQLARGVMPKRRLGSALNRLKKKAYLNKMLIDGVKNGNIRMVKRLLSQGANVNAYVKDGESEDKITALLAAIQYSPKGDVKVAMVKLLLKSGANPNKKSSKWRHAPLLLSVWYDLFAETLKLLLAHPRINPNLEDYQGKTALSLAISNGMQTHAVLIMQDPRTRLNGANKNGWTPLGQAYCAGGVSTEIASTVAYLKKYGATVCTGCSLCP
jgi:hypothetical protein